MGDDKAMTTEERTAQVVNRWGGLLDRLAQGPEGWGPHDTDALCEQVRRLVEERDAAIAQRDIGRGLLADQERAFTQSMGIVMGEHDAAIARAEAAEAEVRRLRKDCQDAMDLLMSTDHMEDGIHGRCVACSQRWPCETGEAVAVLAHVFTPERLGVADAVRGGAG